MNTYTVGIIEDEVIEQEALQIIIRTRHPDLSVAFVANDSEQARSYFKDCTPDILILDVNLPGDNGLEFGKRLRKSGYAGLIIVNTAYAQFEYAQSAVQINAFDYLLKPCDPMNISRVLFSCVEKLRREAESRNQQINLNQMSHSYIFEHIGKADTSLASRLEQLGWPPDGELQAVVMDYHLADDQVVDALLLENTDAREFMLLYGHTIPGHFLVIAQPRTSMSSAWLRAALNLCALNLIDTLPSCKICVISPVCKTQAELAQNISELPLKRQAPGKESAVWFLTPSPGHAVFQRFSVLQTRLSRLFRDKKTSRFQGLLMSALEKTPGDKSETCAALLCVLMNSLYSCGIPIPFSSFQQMLGSRGELNGQMQQLLDTLEPEFEKYCGKSTMNLALSIVESEFKSPLSQGNIAELLGVNQSYFSLLFKKHTGMNFVDYLTRIRMEHAKVLIAMDPGIALEVLATECGCANKYYFCNIFRKYTGMTVNQYRILAKN